MADAATRNAAPRAERNAKKAEKTPEGKRQDRVTLRGYRDAMSPSCPVPRPLPSRRNALRVLYEILCRLQEAPAASREWPPAKAVNTLLPQMPDVALVSRLLPHLCSEQ